MIYLYIYRDLFIPSNLYMKISASLQHLLAVFLSGCLAWTKRCCKSSHYMGCWQCASHYNDQLETPHPIGYCNCLLYPPKRSLGGVYWIHPVRPSVCLSVCPSVRPWVGVRMITLILFSGFKNFFLHISLGSRSCMGLNISVLPH